MSFRVTTEPGLLLLELVNAISVDEMAAFVRAHNDAIEGFAGADYRVLCDIRGLAPLAPLAAALFAEAKAFSAAAPNFRGSAVLVASALVALQHERISIAGGVMATELITDDELAAREHLARVHRLPPRSVHVGS